jgi:lipopolysaccharide export system protein LptA
MRNNFMVFKSIFIIFLTFITSYVYAINLPDEEQPMNIESNKLQSDEIKAISIYTGNAVLTQGTLYIAGNNITFHHPNSKIEKATVLGKQAQFKKYFTADKRWVKGHADKIVYNPASKEVIFTGNATVNQVGKTTISGPFIHYDMLRKTISARATRTEHKRIKMTFLPETNKQNKKK